MMKTMKLAMIGYGNVVRDYYKNNKEFAYL